MWITLAPDISGVYNPIPYLNILMDRVNTITLEDNRAGVNRRNTEVYIHEIAQILYGMGDKYP